MKISRFLKDYGRKEQLLIKEAVFLCMEERLNSSTKAVNLNTTLLSWTSNQLNANDANISNTGIKEYTLTDSYEIISLSTSHYGTFCAGATIWSVYIDNVLLTTLNNEGTCYILNVNKDSVIKCVFTTTSIWTPIYTITGMI